ncbi:MAG: 3-hydroxyacyl-ACP dehydratase FabZ [Candidatus Omnitrophota bacterium]
MFGGKENKFMINPGIGKVLNILPQRYPFLFIDRIVEFEKGKKVVVLKNVTANESYFTGHFPQRPVMPGVLLIETMVQAGMIFLSLNSLADIKDAKSADIYYLCSVKARFLKPAAPGDQVFVEIAPVKTTKDLGIVKAVAMVDGKEIARAEIAGARQK